MRYFLAMIVYLALSLAAFGQGAVLQGGSWTAGHAPMYVGNNYSQAFIQDSGPAGGGGVGVGLSEQLLTARGTGTAPYAGQGTGPLGTNWCDYDAPISNATGYHFLCMSPNADGGGLIDFGAGGGASALPFQFIINGTPYAFPVTPGDLAPIAANTLIGNATSATAPPTAVPINNCTNALTWTANTGFGCNITPGTGTVTSVGMTVPSFLAVAGSPVTSNGTLAVTLATESANTFFAGPTSGSAATPTFRSIAGADFGSQLPNVVFAGPASGGSNAPTFRSIVSADLPSSLVGAQSANTFYAGPSSGSAAAPGFRTLTLGDLPSPLPTGTVDNLLPNVQNQLASEFGWIPKQNQLGEASQSIISCSSFQTSNPDPNFVCANTGQLKTYDLVIVEETSGTPDNTFWTFPAVGNSFGCSGSGATHIVLCNNGAIASNRVDTVTANTSATLLGNFSSESPASSVATFLQPIGIGDLGTTTFGFDGYTKTQTLNCWADDFAANSYPGQIRPLACRKGSSSSESYTFTVPLNKVGSYQGQTLSCGVEILSRGNAGTGNFTESITDSVNGTTTSASLGSGAGYQFITVTHAIGANATSVSESINLTGASGDVYYAAKHTCAFVPSLVASQLHINSAYKIEATQHWNPPLTTPFVIGFPGTTCNVSGYYCFIFNDIEALSLGQAHSSLAAVDYKAEFTYSTPGTAFFTSGGFNGATGQWNFAGPECVTQVANILVTCGGNLDLYSNEAGFVIGTFSMITTVSAMAGENITYDFWNAYGGIGNSAD